MLAVVPCIPFLPLERLLKPRQEISYRVEQTWSGDDGEATFKYRLSTRVTQQDVENKALWFLNVKMQDLQAEQNGQAAPRVKLAGVFTLELGSTGGFQGLHLAGDVSVFGFSLVAWYLPPRVTVRPQEIVPLSIENGADVVGTVQWVGARRGNALLKYELYGGPTGAGLEQRPTKLTFVSEFRASDGRLISTEGDIVDQAGTTHFRIGPS